MNSFSAWCQGCKCALCVAALAFSTTPVFAAIDVSPAALDRVDEHVAKALERANIPGAALAIVRNGKVALLKGYGTTGPEGRPVDGSTAFVIGSVSKSVTALAAMHLAEQGRLDLDAPVQSYLPWFRTADGRAGQILVRHLMSHSSGLSTKGGRQTLAEGNDSTAAIELECRRLAQGDLQFRPGEGFEYSNSNFDVLGAIVEAVAGKPFEEAMRKCVLDPLGMDQSFYFRGEHQGNLATGHRMWFGWPVAAHGMPVPRQHWPSGYLCSTVDDMARYVLAHLQGEAGIAGVVSGRGLARLHTPQAPMAPDIDYAMGLMVVTWDGKTMIAHEGVVPDYYAHVLMYPEDDLGIVLLCNAFSMAHCEMPLRYCVINAGRILQGQDLVPVPRNWVVTIGMAVVTAALILPAVFAVWTLRRLRHARTASQLRLVLVSTTVFVLFGFSMLVGVPWIFEMPWRGLLLFVPDFGWLVLLSTTLALAWTIVCNAVAWRWPKQSAIGS